jgi:acyl-CoA reductase-like NAD-dependent aldehyde dehydrogenase
VVLKPSSDGMACAEALASCFDLPPGVFQVLHGRGAAGARLADHPGVKALSFTGSTTVGQQLIATCAANGIAVQAEMGGSNAVVVLPDADLEAAATMVAGAAMAFAGQKCTATSRIVTVGVGVEFREAFVEAVRALRVGDPAEPDTVVGPVIGEEPRRSVIEAAEDARDRGGRILAGGREVDGEGWFVQPTVVDGVPSDGEMAREEVFGPVCAVFDARDDDEAVAIANSTRYGLVAALHTRDLDRALRISERLDAGMIRVNAPTTGVDFHAPFGGAAGSSYGPREQGRAAREFYTTTATVTVSPSRSDST